MTTKVKLKDLLTAVKQAKKDSLYAEWVSVTVDEGNNRCYIQYEDANKCLCRVEVFHASNNVTPRIHRTSDLYPEE